ncbi:hypothetical protein D3C85_1525040 [compost metagenome]
MGVGSVEAASGALEFHIQSAIAFGCECHANDIPRIGDGKTRQFRIGKNRAALGLGDHLRKLARAVQHE